VDSGGRSRRDLLAVRDARFGASARAEHAFYDWFSQLNRDLFEAPPYVGTVAFADPVDVLPHLPAIWESLHEGVSVTMAIPSRRCASATVTYPRRLFTPVSLESLRRTLTMLLAKTGAAQVNVGSSSVVTGEETRTCSR
jgi:hypothetical protein